MATLTWLGHAAFLLETDRGKRVYVDPFLTGNPTTPEDEKTPERVDVIAVTHGHGDHVGDTVALSQRFPDAEIVCQVELKSWLGRQGANVGDDPRPEQGRHAARSTASRFTLTNAFHSSGADDGRVPRRGVRVRDQARGRRRRSTSPATPVVFGDMQLIRHLYEPQLAVLPIGDHFTMGPARGGGRARHARQAALRAVPLGHVPAADRHAGAAARRARPRAPIIARHPPGRHGRGL